MIRFYRSLYHCKPSRSIS